MRYGQTLAFGTPEWRSVYATARNTMEGFNGFVKDANHEALGDPMRRRVRGYTACFVFSTVLVMSANLRKVHAFPKASGGDSGRSKPIRRTKRPKRRKADIRDWSPATIEPAAPDPPAAA